MRDARGGRLTLRRIRRPRLIGARAAASDTDAAHIGATLQEAAGGQVTKEEKFADVGAREERCAAR